MLGRTNTGGGGGGGLNFRVIGGTSTPSNPKENDIWVESSVEVNGYIFSAEATPSNIYETELTCVDNLSGQYIGENGEISTNQNFAVSDYVELPKTTTHITVEHSITASSVMYHAFYDNNKNFISSVFRENTTMVYEVPSNAAYARLSLCIKEDRVDNHKIIATVDDGSIVEGTVLINIGTSSVVAFNALKKNSIMVYPISAKQYVSGAWVDKTAKSYQNGEWKTMLPLGYLFYFGKQQYLWQARGWAMNQYGFTAKSPTVTENADGSVTISMPYSSTKYSGVYEIAEDFDVTNYNTLTIDETHNHLGYYLAVVNRNATYCHENSVAVANLDNSNTLDISSLNGKYDIVIIIRVGQSGEGTTAKEMVFNSLIAE